MKFCTEVRADFVDAGGAGKEDYLNGNTQNVRLPFAFVYLLRTDALPYQELWRAWLNEDGCTDFLNLEGGAHYNVRLATMAGTVGNRAVYIPQDGDQECGYWCTEPMFFFSQDFSIREDIESTVGNEFIWFPDYQGPRISLLLVASRMLALHDLVAYPENTSTVFKLDGTNDCDQGQYGGAFNYGETGRICATSTNNTYQTRHLATDAAYYKFVTGHELGHRIQYANVVSGTNYVYCAASPDHDCVYGGWEDPDSGEWVDDPNDPANNAGEYCGCGQVQPDDGSRAHCFQSREPIGHAMEEGYGHFVSSVLFNERPADGAFDPSDCFFAHCKQGWDWGFVGNDFSFLFVDESPPIFHNCSNIRPRPNGNDPTRFPFMDNLCNPGDEDVGVERDWLSFYWSLYADDRGAPGDHRFNVADVLLSFGFSDRNYYFQKSWNTVKALWQTSDSVKTDNFWLFASEMGVAHCKDGCVF